MTISTFRELSTDERELLNRLLEEPFPGRDELALQLSGSQVRVIDADGSMEFHVASADIAPVRRRVPTEARYDDSDGTPVHLLLHVVAGKVAQLEIYKADGSTIERRPSPSDLQVSHS